MDNLTRIVKTEISRQYKSVRQFAFAVNIPLSTINSALHNGIGGSSFEIKNCFPDRFSKTQLSYFVRIIYPPWVFVK